MDLMEIFTLVTGVIYIILEIRQKSLMWAVGVLTSVAAMVVFFRQGLYASFGLNTYYLVMSFIGLWQWSRDKKKLGANVTEAAGESGDRPAHSDEIHLNKLSVKVLVISIVITATGIFALSRLMEWLENPMSLMDASVAVLSAVATWWLTKAYLEQWWIWIVADILSTVMCAMSGLWWMTALYGAYTVSAVIGLVHWKRHGIYIG
ncbi:MAG: nicotinamide riboside transporter PnuC [Candidatus Cryptobacteroides sp.]